MGYVSELMNKVSFEVNQSSVNDVNNAIQTIKSSATKLLGMIGIGFSLSALNSIAEEFEEINNKIAYAVDASEELEDVQEQILEAANESRVSYSDLADAVVDLKQANAEVFPMEDAIEFVEYVNKLGQAAGYSDSELSSMTTIIQQIAANGEATTSNVTSMLQQAPALAEQIASALEVSTDELSDMAEEGELTIETIKDAILSSTEEIDEAMDSLSYTVSDALLNIRNKWGFWVEDVNDTFGITDTIAKALVSGFDKFMSVLDKVKTHMEWFVEVVGGTENALKLIVAVAGALFVAFNFDKITTGIGTIFSALKTLAGPVGILLVAFLAVFLLVEDFVAFLQGKDSVIGTVLENAGVDVDAFRENCVIAFEKIGQIASAVWQGILNVILPILQGIVDAFLGLIETVAPELAEMIEDFANGDIDTEKWVALGETIGNILVKVVAFLAIFNTVSTVVKTVSGVISGVGTAISALSSPIGIAVIAITAIIVIIIAVITHWDELKEAVGNAAEKIKTFVGGLVSSATTFFTNMKTAVLTTVSNFVSSVIIFFISLGATIVATVSNLASRVATFFTNLASGAATTVSNFVGNVVSFFTGMQEQASAIAENIWSTVSSFFSDIAADILTAVTNAAQWVSEKFEEIRSRIGEAVSNALEAVKSTFDSMKSAVQTKVSDIKGAIVDGFQEAIDWITSLPAQAMQWGADIINGIVEGINSAISNVTTAVSSVASTISGYLGFSVPEEGPLSDFDTYMPDMLKLMAEGIEENKEKVLSAMEGLSGDMSVMAQANLVSGGTASAAAGMGGQSTSNVSQTVTINNTFNGDKAGQQKSAQAMEKASADITSELARALAYT